VALPASGCEMLANMGRSAISPIRVVINWLQLLPGWGRSPRRLANRH